MTAMTNVAQVFPMKPPTVNALVAQINAAWDRADQFTEDMRQASAKADEWQVRTGKLLIDLKAQVKTEGGSWLETLKKMGRSNRRAQELMALAVNTAIIEQQRDRKRESMQKSRAKEKGPSRDGPNRDKSDTPVVDLTQKYAPRGAHFSGKVATVADEPEAPDEDYGPNGDGWMDTQEERWRISLANCCGDLIAQEALWNKTFPGWKNFECPSHIKTLMKEAVTALASIVKIVGVK